MRILGPLDVVSGGSSVALGGHKQRAVLAILATHPGTVVSADELIESLWSDGPPATATTTVQVYVSRLRKLIGSDLIATTGAGYVLRVEPDQLDAARFDRLAARGRELRGSGKPREAATALGEALSLWRGPALADFAYDSWAQSDIARLEEERLACLEERLEADLASGRDSDLVGELESLAAEHPLRERLRGQLMLALYRAGRQADALEAYQRARSTLVDELGIEPGPELQELNRKILTQDVSPAAPPSQPSLPTGTVTLLATDIEGSTPLLAELGLHDYADALAAHRQVLRSAFAGHDGVEVDTQGDAFLFAFVRANDAVRAAADAQRELADGPVRVRMGLHSGEPLVTAEGYVGIDVHQAARVMSAGHGGQVLVSQATQALLDSDVQLRDLGAHRLKDLTAAQRLHQLGDEQFPPLKTLHQANLPVQPTPLVGRGQELGQVLELLSGARLVTLTGAGGCGKTRLALQAAAELVEEYPHGVWWVSLAALRDPELVESTIAQIVGAKDGLADHLRGQTTLLLLDNFEHLLAAAPRIATLLAQAPDLRILATSRERLALAAEQEYPVPNLADEEAVELFTARARQLRPRFEPDGAVAEICGRLGGLPLAIELAAARTTVLGSGRILERLGGSLDLLTSGRRDAPERHQTLRATIEWSYELLGLDERDAFARLGVFAGSFDLDAADAICKAEIDTLTALVDKNLVRANEDRFFVLEPIREYALERLDEVGQADDVRLGHLEYFVALAESSHDEMERSEQDSGFDVLVEWRDDFRMAIDWAGGREDVLALRACSALASFWSAGSDVHEGRRRLMQALERAARTPPELRAAALDGAAVLSHECGDYEAECRFALEQLALADELGDPEVRARALSNLALGVAAAEGDLERSAGLLEESVELARKSGSRWALMVSALNLGSVSLARGDHLSATASLEEALELSRALGDPVIRMHTLFNLGRAQLEAGELEGAAAYFAQCVRLSRQMEFWDGIVYCLVGLAKVALEQDDAERAERLLATADRGRNCLGIGFEPPEQELFDQIARALGSRFEHTDGGVVWTARAQSELEEAADYALSLD